MEPIRDRQTTHPAIEDLRRHIGAVVTLDGSVETLRDQKRMQFLILNRHGGAVQVVHEKAGADDRLAQRLGALTPGSAVTVRGTVREAASVKLNGLEIEAADIVV
ncbi:MAG: OB-fold nucleic acid binding domain-containing protein, partial [Alphaproteobacteria bacterium]